MTVEIVAKVAASASLDVINGIVVQNENTIGPLTQIGIDKGLTALTFAVDDPPAQHAVISKDIDGTPTIPDGSTVIDTDLILLIGLPTLCTAVRPN
jgi:hypothetical protein